MKINISNTATKEPAVVKNEQKFNFTDDDIMNLLKEYCSETIIPRKAQIDEADVDDQPFSDIDSLTNLDIDDEPFELISASKEQEPVKPFVMNNMERTPAPVAPGDDTGVASLLNSLLINAFSTIENYNSALATIASLPGNNAQYNGIYKIISDLVNEEHTHVGQLQRALQEVSPNAMSIEDGRMKADEQVDSAPGIMPILQVQSAIPVVVNNNPACNNNSCTPQQSTVINNGIVDGANSDVDMNCSVMDIDDEI